VADPYNADILSSGLTGRRRLVADSYDVVIVGVGHNGLVCACCPAAADLNVKVVEQRSVVRREPGNAGMIFSTEGSE
jgi:ribulose 1,5-bisphosphate synthetase/thiazole synthase